MPGSGDPHEMRHLGEALVIMPGHDAGQRICAGDEEHLDVIAPLFGQFGDGVHRVRGSRTFDVDTRHREVRIVDGSQQGHQVAVLSVADPTGMLLPRLPRGHEDDFSQTELFSYLGSSNQVTVVNRIERATHDADTTGRGHLRPARVSGRCSSG